MPFKCLNCGKIFEEYEEVNTTYEEYNGVSGLFGSSHPITLYVCPYCHDEDIEKVEDEILEEDEE